MFARMAHFSLDFIAYCLCSCMWLSLIVAGLCVGCSQDTAAPVAQVTGQDVTSPTVTEQDAATQGSQVNVWVINAPGRGGLPDPSPLAINPESGISQLIAEVKNADGAAIEGMDAGYAQAGINININTGSTTPSLAGTTTATASPSQTPSGQSTANPTQTVRPELTGSVPIGVALPGGMVDQQAVATGRGQTADTEKQSENQLRWAKLEAMSDKLEKLLPLLEAIFDVPAGGEGAATTQPAG